MAAATVAVTVVLVLAVTAQVTAAASAVAAGEKVILLMLATMAIVKVKKPIMTAEQSGTTVSKVTTLASLIMPIKAMAWLRPGLHIPKPRTD
jgi:hypothetical protein